MGPGPNAFIRDAQTARERAARDLERGRVTEAIEMLEVALSFEPDDVETHTMLGIGYARSRQIERAFTHLERALDLEPRSFRARCALGELYMRLGIPERARPELERAQACATSATERAYVEALLIEERSRVRRHAPRPSFRQPVGFLRGRRPRRA
jgi:Tfp pilus assembly protein PilF